MTGSIRYRNACSGCGREYIDGQPDLDLVRFVEATDENLLDATLGVVNQFNSLEGVQVICPKRDMVDALNTGLQRFWNASGTPLKRTSLRHGDCVMCTRNQYEEPTIMNGEQGILRVKHSKRGTKFSLKVKEGSRGPFDYEEHHIFQLA